MLFKKQLLDAENTELSRRQILHNLGMAAAGAVGAQFLSSCGPGIASQGIIIDPVMDAGVLNAALVIEQELVGLYTAIIGLNIWQGTTTTSQFGDTILLNNGLFLSTASAFSSHHAQHAQDLNRMIQNRGAAPVTNLTPAEYLIANNMFGNITLNQALILIMNKEKLAAAFYAKSAQTFTDVTAAGWFAKLAADEGAHFGVYRAVFSLLLGDTVNGGTTSTTGTSASTMIGGAYPVSW